MHFNEVISGENTLAEGKEFSPSCISGAGVNGAGRAMCVYTLRLGLGEQAGLSCRHYSLGRLNCLAWDMAPQAGLRYSCPGQAIGVIYQGFGATDADIQGGENMLFSSFYWKHLSQTCARKKYSQTESLQCTVEVGSLQTWPCSFPPLNPVFVHWSSCCH